MTVRYGFIGAGAIAHSSASAVQANEHSKVVAAFDPNSSRLQELCKEQEIPNAYDTVEGLLADQQVDAVYVAVPNKFHAPLAQQALKAGKHVLLDKPFALNVAEAEAVIAAAKESGKLFTLGMNQRFREDSQKIRTLVKDGCFGEIYHAKASWIRRSGIPRLGTWFGNKELAGGGALLDIGVHLLDLCLYTIGNFKPIAVSGATYTKFGNRGLGEGGWGRSDREGLVFDVDDFATAMIRLENDVTISLDVTWACHTDASNKSDVRIFGTEAGAGLYPARVFRADPIRTDYDVIDNVNAQIPWAHQDRFANFTDAIRGEDELCCTIDQALAVQRILDAIYESSETGKEVRLDG